MFPTIYSTIALEYHYCLDKLRAKNVEWARIVRPFPHMTRLNPSAPYKPATSIPCVRVYHLASTMTQTATRLLHLMEFRSFCRCSLACTCAGVGRRLLTQQATRLTGGYADTAHATLTGGPGAEPIKQMLDDKMLLCYPTPPWSIRTRIAVGVGDD